MSDVDLEQLNDMQLDVLKEIGNIGAGNATTALSTMLNVKMDMSVPPTYVHGTYCGVVFM